MTLEGEATCGRLRTGTAAACLVVAAWAVSGVARADDWTLTPHAEVRENFTDNVRGVSGAARESDFLTTVMAGIAARDRGARASVDLSYDIALDRYVEAQDLDGIRHRLLGLGVLDVVPDALFLDLRGAVSQQPLRRRGGDTAIERRLADNQTRVINYAVSPYYRHAFGTFAEAMARYRYNQVMFTDTRRADGDEAPRDARIHDASLMARSGPEFTRFLWDVAAEKVHTDIEGGRSRDETVIQGSREYRVNRMLSILGGIGYEDITDSGPTPDVRGLVWHVGTRLTPGPRTELLLRYGRRFGGQHWTGEVRHRIGPHLSFQGGYRVTLASQQQILADRLNDLDAEREPAADLRTGLVADPNAAGLDLVEATLRQKTLAGTLTGDYLRTRFTVGGFRTVRERLDGGARDVVVGVETGASRDLTEHLTLTVALGWSHTPETRAVAGRDTTWDAGASLAWRLSPGLTAGIGYDHRRVDREHAPSFGENVIMARIRKEF
ncbi:MAG: TIGR03016 family PEP-CTERM system-associated outer membrane protein [Alphaproteobacteria bacterium]